MNSSSHYFSRGTIALFCGKGMDFRPKVGTLQASFNGKSEFLNLHVYPALTSIDSFRFQEHGCNVLKLSLKSRTSQSQALVVRSDHPQNSDFPKYYSKKEKKPFPVPIVDLRRAARERLKSRKGKPKTPVPPPKNGLLVKALIPVAYDVFNERITLINNLKKLLKVVPVQACRFCNEIHVGPVGHPFKSCKGANANIRKGVHEWITNATVDDVFLPVEAFHLYDRLGRRIPHEERFSIPRIPAIVELCIQAGVDVPEYPTKRRRKPIIRISKSEFVDADESELPDPDTEGPKRPVLTEIPDSEIVAPSDEEETTLLAEETLRAWDQMRRGAKRLMKMYLVRWAQGSELWSLQTPTTKWQHGWQAAVLNDLIPPRYVWHVPDVNGPPMERELRNYYGQAPAVVEMCIQAGAAVPEEYRPTMRLDVGIPSTIKEAEMVV
ncbi:APO protein 2 chloroplastic [Prunus yedoensis var. nudiflora]|uniref:APO protein 2 chloroplastic n=1 Tax=Prunus yedoensis var. nudiflora TaxID=2094558 RepID=A0A314Y5L0_PRUYE|nr:APO protein 2 chloroplastic [Prunus yedoensis var. nudiflora]